MSVWSRISNLFGGSQLLDLIVKSHSNTVIYPDADSTYYVDKYAGNSDVFSVINKIAEPASRIPILQVDKKTLKEKAGKGIELLSKPNPSMSDNEFHYAALVLYKLFGELFIAYEVPSFGLNSGRPRRLDLLPPQWVELDVGTLTEPIKGYSLNMGSIKVNYAYEQVLHWKDFNPNFQLQGTHLRGLSRLQPLMKSIIASDSGYDSLVYAFQNQGAYGILTILGVKEEDGKYSNKPTTKEQLAALEESFKAKLTGDINRGKVFATNKSVDYTDFGLSPVDLNILESLKISVGKICDAYNYPDVLISGSESKTYMNYAEAMKAAWNNAIIPSLDGYLAKLSDWLLPKFGEEDTKFIANYDDVPALQEDKAKTVEWMVKAGLTGNEIRMALGYEPRPDMDIPLINITKKTKDE